MNSTYEYELQNSPIELAKETTEALNWVKGQAYNIVTQLDIDMVDELKDKIYELDVLTDNIAVALNWNENPMDTYRSEFVPTFEEAMELIDALNNAL